jgi:hypothetical protein
MDARVAREHEWLSLKKKSGGEPCNRDNQHTVDMNMIGSSERKKEQRGSAEDDVVAVDGRTD